MKGKDRIAVLLAGAAAAAAIAAAAAAAETIAYVYDARGRLTSTATSTASTVNHGLTTWIGYDSAGNRALYGNASAGPPAFYVSDASAVEDRTIVFTVIKSGAAAASVSYTTANGTAGGGGDYTGASGGLDFPAGENSKTVTVAAIDDSVDENPETFSLNLSGASAGATIVDAQGIGTIYDNDEPPPPPPPPPPSFSVSDVTATEGGLLVFTVTKTGPTVAVFSISYATANGTAYGTYEGGDYYQMADNLFFAASDTSKTVTVAGQDDSVDENDETFFLNLSTASGGATISDAQGTGTIVDNDDPPVQPPGNTPPTPANDSGSMSRCSTESFNVTANDTDPDGNYPLTVQSVTGNGFGLGPDTSSVTVDSTNLSSGASGTYTVRDSGGATATATLTITLSGAGTCNS